MMSFKKLRYCLALIILLFNFVVNFIINSMIGTIIIQPLCCNPINGLYFIQCIKYSSHISSHSIGLIIDSMNAISSFVSLYLA